MPDLAEHLAGAAHLAGLGILEHEHEQVALWLALLAREALSERASLATRVPLSAAGW